MSHGSEDAETLADVVYQFTSMGGEVIFQVRNDHRITLRDLQIMKGTAKAVLVELERAIQVVTPIEQAENGERCTCYPSGRMNLSPADGHIPRCPWYRPGPE